MADDFIISDKHLQMMANKIGFWDELTEEELVDIKVAFIGDTWKHREERILPIIKHAIELRMGAQIKPINKSEQCTKNPKKYKCCLDEKQMKIE